VGQEKLLNKHKIKEVSPMDLTTFMMMVYCLIEDTIAGPPNEFGREIFGI